MEAALEPELVLLAACCRWPPSPERAAAVRAAAGTVDWARFEQLVARHRVAGLAWDGLRAAGVAPPEAISARLAGRARGEAATALFMAAETARLQHAFDAAGLKAMSFKGTALALRAYGTLAVKQARDIDFLVAREQVPAVRQLLEREGYALSRPDIDTQEQWFELSLDTDQEQSFRHRASGVILDLHWRLGANPAFTPALGLGSPTQEIAVAGGTMRTLADVPLYVYLCAHGCAHGWFRLKWLADVAALVARHGDAGALHRAAREMGNGRVSAVALLLSRDLLGLDLPPALARELRAERIAAALVRMSLTCLASPYGRGKPPLGFVLRTTAMKILLKPDARYLAYELGRSWVVPADRMAFPLPKPLHFLYALIRIPSALLRRALRALPPADRRP